MVIHSGFGDAISCSKGKHRQILYSVNIWCGYAVCIGRAPLLVIHSP